MKENKQFETIREINPQSIGPFFSTMTDSSNVEQLGLVLLYTKDKTVVGRLYEYV